jgi:glycosyltransferase involved in cell wall biosynthesis
MLKVAVVPSHPFHVGPAEDSRIVNQIYHLVDLGVELHFISPFRDMPLPKHPLFHFHSISSHPILYESFYRLTRRSFYNPLIAPLVLSSRRYLELSASSFAKRLERVLKSLDVDVTLAIQHVAAAACAKIKDKLGIPVVLDICGIWAETMIDSKTLKSGSVPARRVREFELDVIRQMDYLIALTEEMKEYLVEQYFVEPERIVRIMHAIRPRVKEAKKVSKPSRIVHAGTFSYREHTDMLLRSMPFVLKEYPAAELYMTKKGDDLKKAIRLAGQLKVSPNYFYFSSPGNFYNFLESCHIGIITSSDDIARRVGCPAKVFDYMSVGLPVVANDVGIWTRFIRESGGGILTDNTPLALANGILELLRNPDLIYEMGEKGLNFLRRVLDPDKALKDFYDVLRHASQTV